MNYSPNEKFQQLLTLLKGGKFTLGLRTGDDAWHQAFLDAFPASGLADLSLAQYVVGSKAKSLTYWVEKSLGSVPYEKTLLQEVAKFCRQYFGQATAKLC